MGISCIISDIILRILAVKTRFFLISNTLNLQQNNNKNSNKEINFILFKNISELLSNSSLVNSVEVITNCNTLSVK